MKATAHPGRARGALTYLPMLEFGESWIGVPGFSGASLLLVAPPRNRVGGGGAEVLRLGG